MRHDILKAEIARDPRGIGYAGKQPWEIAELMNRELSQDPAVFEVRPVDQRQYIAGKIERDITATEFDLVKTYVVDTTRIVKSTELAPKNLEVLAKRADQLGLGPISQGDIEEALKR